MRASRALSVELLTLHSNLVIFKWVVGACRVGQSLPLHSNLVIFKLNPIYDWTDAEILYIPIWLYSNYLMPAPGFSIRPSLHSNLVIFKYTQEDGSGITIPDFTFQSGYIQMSAIHLDKFSDENFTFQSGYIQID